MKNLENQLKIETALEIAILRSRQRWKCRPGSNRLATWTSKL